MHVEAREPTQRVARFRHIHGGRAGVLHSFVCQQGLFRRGYAGTVRRWRLPGPGWGSLRGLCLLSALRVEFLLFTLSESEVKDLNSQPEAGEIDFEMRLNYDENLHENGGRRHYGIDRRETRAQGCRTH